MKQREALAILNKERNYEDRLAEDLDSYFLYSLDAITELTPLQREKIEKHLTIIIRDSRRHGFIFGELIQFVLEHGENNY